MTIIICGDRHYTNVAKIRKFVQSLPKDTVIIQGGAEGADTIARDMAIECGLKYYTYNANWTEYGRAAGPIRNKQMLTEGKPDFVIAYHDHIEASRGTKNMLAQARAASVITLLNPREWVK